MYVYSVLNFTISNFDFFPFLAVVENGFLFCPISAQN